MARSYGRATLTKRRRRDGSSVWVARWYDQHGNRRQRDLGLSAEPARAAFREILEERDRRILGVDLSPREIRDAYVAELRATRTAGHADRIAGCLDAFIASGLPCTVAGLVAWRQRRLAQGVARSTGNKEVGAVRSMYTWAHRLGFVRDPIGALPSLSPRGHERLRRRALSDAEIGRLIAAARADDQYTASIYERPRVPQAPLWLLLLETGAR